MDSGRQIVRWRQWPSAALFRNPSHPGEHSSRGPGVVPGDVGSRGTPQVRRQAGSYLGQVVLVPQVHPHRGPFCLPLCKYLVSLDPAAGATQSPPPHRAPQDYPGITLVQLYRADLGKEGEGLKWGSRNRSHILSTGLSTQIQRCLMKLPIAETCSSCSLSSPWC